MTIDRDYELMREERDAAEARATAAADRLEDETRRREKAEEKLRIAERQAVMASEITAEANARATAARGLARVLHGHLNALAHDVNAYLKDINSRGAAFLVVCRLADVEAALALPYSPQGGPPEVMSGRLGGGGEPGTRQAKGEADE